MKEETEALNTELELCNIDIKENSLQGEYRSTYHRKIYALTRLAEITQDPSHYHEALISCNEAIAINPQDRIHLLDRSKLHITLDRPDLALLDIIAAQKVPNTSDEIYSIYCKYSVITLLRLPKIQAEVKKSAEEGKLSLAEIATYFPTIAAESVYIGSRKSDFEIKSNSHDVESVDDALALEQAMLYVIKPFLVGLRLTRQHSELNNELIKKVLAKSITKPSEPKEAAEDAAVTINISRPQENNAPQEDIIEEGSRSDDQSGDKQILSSASPQEAIAANLNAGQNENFANQYKALSALASSTPPDDTVSGEAPPNDVLASSGAQEEASEYLSLELAGTSILETPSQE